MVTDIQHHHWALGTVTGQRTVECWCHFLSDLDAIKQTYAAHNFIKLYTYN